MKTHLLIASALLLTAIPAMRAQENTDEPKLKITPNGRILMDGALFASPAKENFKDGVQIPDARLGLKATYGKWAAKIDVGFAKGKVGLKDLYVQYNFDEENSLRGGSFIHQYGLQSATSSSWKITYEEPMSNAVFNVSRQIGVMYVHSADKFLGTLSVHAEPQSIILTPNQLSQEGYGVTSRLVYRPMHTDGNIVHVGISGGFATPNTDGDGGHSTFTFGGNFPTRVVSVKAVDATMRDAMNQWKFTPELLLATGPVALEAQYFFNRVNFRKGLHSYTGQGAYATLRGLLNGGHYGYNLFDGGIGSPGKGACELVVGYNFTTLTDRKAQQIADNGDIVTGIYGGSANTLSATFNYYINKYMVARLNYTYTHTYNGAKLCTDFNAFQVRFQVVF